MGDTLMIYGFLHQTLERDRSVGVGRRKLTEWEDIFQNNGILQWSSTVLTAFGVRCAYLLLFVQRLTSKLHFMSSALALPLTVNREEAKGIGGTAHPSSQLPFVHISRTLLYQGTISGQ